MQTAQVVGVGSWWTRLQADLEQMRRDRVRQQVDDALVEQRAEHRADAHPTSTCPSCGRDGFVNYPAGRCVGYHPQCGYEHIPRNGADLFAQRAEPDRRGVETLVHPGARIIGRR